MDKQNDLKQMLADGKIAHDSESIHQTLNKHKQNKTGIKTKKNEKVKSNFIDLMIYILAASIIVAIIFTIYLFTQYTQPDKSIKTTKHTELIFSNLPQTIQKKYIIKADMEEKISILNKKHKEKIKSLSKQLKDKTDLYKAAPYNDINKDHIVQKNSAKVYAVAKCYDMGAGSVKLTPKCQKNIKTFLDKYKGVKSFEVVGVIGQSDTKVFDKIKALDKSIIDTHKKHYTIGLAQTRANEVTWYMRKLIGNDVTIDPVSYTVNSKKDNKGAVIRIYK